jgi:CxxC motif-containing protein (DUF1111 family)
LDSWQEVDEWRTIVQWGIHLLKSFTGHNHFAYGGRKKP